MDSEMIIDGAVPAVLDKHPAIRTKDALTDESNRWEVFNGTVAATVRSQ
jgi:hypothetical protein